MLCSCASTLSEPPSREPSYSAAVAARTRGDAEAFVEEARHLVEAAPNHPEFRIMLAEALTAAGRAHDAQPHLRALAESGFGVEALDERVELPIWRALADWAPIEQHLRRNERPRGRGERVVIVTDDIHPEGLVWSPRLNAFIVGDLAGNAIYRVGRDGGASPLWRDQRPQRSTAGLRLDENRGALWACSNDEAQASAELIRIDIDSGISQHLALPAEAGAAFCNDVALFGDDEAIATESLSGRAWRIRSDGSVALFTTASLYFPNGIAIDADARRVFIADALGIGVFDWGGAFIGRLGDRRNFLGGIDGLYVAEPGVLLAVQNGVYPGRVLRLEIDRGELKAITIIASNLPALRGMTTAAPAEGEWAILGRSEDDAGARSRIVFMGDDSR